MVRARRRVMRAPLPALLAALLLAGLSGTAFAADPPASSTRMVTLKNGVRVLLAPDARAAAVSVGVWVETGLRDERPGTIGLSHLVEHLSARGLDPAGVDGVRRRIEALGGTTSSSTTADFTCFLHAVPPAALETVLQMEAGRFTAAPTQAMLDQDRASVRAENRTRARLNPLERPLQVLYSTTFSVLPYRFPSTGIDADLERITLKDCQDYLRARYTPDHTLLTVVGAFDPDQAQQLLRRHFESIGGKAKESRPPAAAKEPEPTGERRRKAPGDVPVPILIVGWRAPASAGDDAAALDLLSALLTGGNGSRLTRRMVVEDQTCVFAHAARDRQRDAMLFWAAVALRPGADSSAVEHALTFEVERLASEPIAGDELDRVRKQLEVALLSGRQSVADRAQVIGAAQMVAGDWHDADRQLERLRALTPDDVQKAAARTLIQARRAVVWMSAAPAGSDSGERAR